MVVPPKHPEMIIFSRKTPMVVGYHHFRKPPYNDMNLYIPDIAFKDVEKLRPVSKASAGAREASNAFSTYPTISGAPSGDGITVQLRTRQWRLPWGDRQIFRYRG